jgi:spermidine/putrescine transport system substrate-binding protein
MRTPLFYIGTLLFWSLCTTIFLYVPQYFVEKPIHSINVLVWPNILDRDLFSTFEKETGIKVYMSYFENYEELFVKLQNSGAQGYDVIMTSDYMAELLIKEDLLDVLDKSKCDFFDRIDVQYLGHYFDKDNRFTTPVALSLYGLGIDLDYFDGVAPQATWGLLFDEKITPGHIGVPDDARELVLIAAQYMFGSIEHLDDAQLEQITTLLKRQKQWVEMYSDLRTDYLLFSKTSPVVAAMHPDLAHAVNMASNIRFMIPQEGAFGVMDSLAIVKGSQNKDASYAFLNFLYKKEVMDYYVKRYKFIPTLKDSIHADGVLSISRDTIMQSVHFFKNVVSPQKLGQIWIAIKS